MSVRKNWLFALGTVLFSAFLAFALLEVGARMMFPELADDETFHQLAWDKLLNSHTIFSPGDEGYSKRFGFQYSKNAVHSIATDEFKYTVRTNSLGFRSNELTPKGEEEYRVLLLGDSFFWGNGLNDPQMISNYLAMHSLQQQPRLNELRVYNYAVDGYNTVQESIVMSTFGQEVQPDYVVLGFFIGNDVVPNALSLVDEQGDYQSRLGMASRLKSRLREALWPWSSLVALRPLLIRGMIPRIRYQLAVQPEIIQASFEAIESIRDRARRLNARFGVVIIYPRDGIQGGLLQQWSNSRSVATIISSYCEDTGIHVVDLLDHMEGEDDKERYYFSDDGHFNAQGAARVAQIVYEELVATEHARRGDGTGS